MSRNNALLCVGLVAFLLVVAMSGVVWVKRERYKARLSESRSRFSQLALALRKYHAEYGQFPPITYSERPGAPKHSWRVLMLPELDMEDAHGDYVFEEAWNGPNNSRLAESLARAPPYFRSPFSAEAMGTDTDYIALRSDDLVQVKGKLRTHRVKERGSEFIIAEIPDSGLHWMSPNDGVALSEVLSQE